MYKDNICGPARCYYKSTGHRNIEVVVLLLRRSPIDRQLELDLCSTTRRLPPAIPMYLWQPALEIHVYKLWLLKLVLPQ